MCIVYSCSFCVLPYFLVSLFVLFLSISLFLISSFFRLFQLLNFFRSFTSFLFFPFTSILLLLILYHSVAFYLCFSLLIYLYSTVSFLFSFQLPSFSICLLLTFLIYFIFLSLPLLAPLLPLFSTNVILLSPSSFPH